MEMRPEIRELCLAFCDGLRDALRDNLYAVYVYGAVTFPETMHTGDVDFHVILASSPTAAESAALLGLHERLAQAFPPLGAELDGYYILESAARGSTPPQHLLFPHLSDESFALHRAHMLAGRVLTLYGPDPREIYAAPAWVELAKALDGELDYVARHLTQYPSYCVLNLCRLVYSHQTRDVVTSKAASAVWAHERLPAWRPLIEAAERSYAHEDTAADRDALVRGVQSFYDFAVADIETRRGEKPSLPRRGGT
jgi:hypothetical protein